MKPKLAAVFAVISIGASAQDAATVLSKARAAYIENRERERFWTWTTVSERSVVGRGDQVLEKLPSVTVESPIRSDGKRCNAILAWGDGVEPYLANASADERCAVEAEVKNTFQMEAFLGASHVKIAARTESAITLAIREDKAAMESEDLVTRCVSSAQGTVEVDPATFFPKKISVTIPGEACVLKRVTATNHYDDTVMKNLTSGFTKGTRLQFEYERQRDKSGNAKKDFWIATHNWSVRPLQNGANAVLISGRRFTLTSSGSYRSMLLDGRTAAAELTAESLIKFETEKEK